MNNIRMPNVRKRNSDDGPHGTSRTEPAVYQLKHLITIILLIGEQETEINEFVGADVLAKG